MSNDVLYVRIPVTINDEEFADPDTLMGNSVEAIQAWLQRGQADNEAEFGPGAYHLDTSDCTVWTEQALTEDLNDYSDTRSRELDEVRYPIKRKDT